MDTEIKTRLKKLINKFNKVGSFDHISFFGLLDELKMLVQNIYLKEKLKNKLKDIENLANFYDNEEDIIISGKTNKEKNIDTIKKVIKIIENILKEINLFGTGFEKSGGVQRTKIENEFSINAGIFGFKHKRIK